MARVALRIYRVIIFFKKSVYSKTFKGFLTF